MSPSLDRPVWASLTHARELVEGGPLARRYRRDVNLFAAARDDSPACLEALTGLVAPGEKVYLLQVPEIVVPGGLTPSQQAEGVQMVATQALDDAPAGAPVVALGDHDASEMLALARLTQPGPFLARTHTMGGFVGIRIDGRLAAMAGTRMRFPGHVEVSGVCTHPDFRGHGLARQLSAHVTRTIQRQGDQALLHAWRGNHAAIALYESLGFVVRNIVQVAVLQRAAA